MIAPEVARALIHCRQACRQELPQSHETTVNKLHLATVLDAYDQAMDRAAELRADLPNLRAERIQLMREGGS